MDMEIYEYIAQEKKRVTRWLDKSQLPWLQKEQDRLKKLEIETEIRKKTDTRNIPKFAVFYLHDKDLKL